MKWTFERIPRSAINRVRREYAASFLSHGVVILPGIRIVDFATRSATTALVGNL